MTHPVMTIQAFTRGAMWATFIVLLELLPFLLK